MDVLLAFLQKSKICNSLLLSILYGPQKYRSPTVEQRLIKKKKTLTTSTQCVLNRKEKQETF